MADTSLLISYSRRLNTPWRKSQCLHTEHTRMRINATSDSLAGISVFVSCIWHTFVWTNTVSFTMI